MIKLIIKPLKMIEIKKILINIYYKVLKIKSRILYGNPVLVLMYHRINNSFGKNLRQDRKSVV